MEQVWSRLQGQTDSRNVRKNAWNTSKSICDIFVRYTWDRNCCNVAALSAKAGWSKWIVESLPVSWNL